MKKLFTRLLVLALALTLTACGGQTANGIPPEGEDDGIVCPAGFDGMEELLAAARAEEARLLELYRQDEGALKIAAE